MPRGVVLHWTGGGPRANSVDLAAYHFVVEADGTIRSGRWSVGANMRPVKGDAYARHTGGFNSFRIGISGAGMLNYASRTSPGLHPLTETQVRRMTELAAYFLSLAALDPEDPRHLCTHREVWTLHGIKGTRNHQKTDIEFLPFLPEVERDAVGPWLRRATASTLRSSEEFQPVSIPGLPPLPPIPVVRPAVVVHSQPGPALDLPAPGPSDTGAPPSLWRRILTRLGSRTPR